MYPSPHLQQSRASPANTLARPATVRLIWAFTLVVALVIALDLVPWLRGDAPWIPADGRWIWSHELPRWQAIPLAAAALAVYVTGAILLLRRTQASRRYPTPLILWAFGGLVLLTLVMMCLEDSPLYLLLARLTAQGRYHAAASAVTSLGHTLRHWPDFTAALLRESSQPNGVVLSPPGLTAISYATARAFDHLPAVITLGLAGVPRQMQCQNLTMAAWSDAQWASAWPQMLMPFWSALSVAPLYRLGTMLFDRQRARWAVAVWVLVPGMIFFQPLFNVLYPLVALVMLVFLWRGLANRQGRWITLAGFVLSVGLFLNLSLVPLGLLAGLIVIGEHLRTRGGFASMARDLTLFGAGVASAWLVYWLLSGLAPWVIFGAGLSQHYKLNRPYLPWLIHHPLDMFLFAGLPLSAFTVWRALRLRHLRHTPATRADVLSGAAVAALVIMVLSGTARGETGRVWLFFAPIWVLMAVDLVATLAPRQQIACLALQAVYLLTLVAVLRGADHAALTRPVRVADAATAPTYPVLASFERNGDRLTFVGLDVQARPDTVTLNLYWQANTPIRDAYVLTLLGIAPDGSTLPGYEWNPRGWDFPPACWKPGQTFVDDVTLPLGDAAQPGDWLFSLAIVDAFTHEPMRVTLPDGTASTQVGIGPVPVPAS